MTACNTASPAWLLLGTDAFVIMPNAVHFSFLFTIISVTIISVEGMVQQVDGVVQLAEGQDVYQLLGSPYQDLWLHWLDEGNEAYKQQAKNSNQERLDFVRAVVAAAAASNAAATQNGSTEPTDNAAATDTNIPKVSISAKNRC